jgi:putative tryptophan/tyrosine transport system substrate-binding protein
MTQFRMLNFEFRIGSATIFIVAFVLGLLASPVPSPGQQPAKVYRIGFLVGRARTGPATTRLWEAFAEGLRERGYIEGQNLVIESRYTEGRDERAPALAAELVSLKPDLIVANGTAQVQAVKQASSAIPIVMVGVVDPVRRGLVASLAHPGGNVTGLTNSAGPEIAGKYLQLLKEAVPRVSRVAVLAYSGGPPNLGYRREIEAASRALELRLQSYRVRNPGELVGVFTAMTKARAEALLVLPHPLFLNARQVIHLAAKSRLPAMYPFKDAVEAGGLMAYETSQPDSFRRIGFYVDKILKGAKPADLPVEQPTKFDLIINLKAAKALGLTLPQSLLNRADEVIQ